LRWLRTPAFFALAAASAYAVIAVAAALVPPGIARPLVAARAEVPKRPCVEWVGGPSPLFFCADGRSWQFSHGAWVDAGAITEMPVVPAS